MAQRLLVSFEDLVSSGRADLAVKIREEPYAYFRFLGLEWTAAVCDEIAPSLDRVPTVNLHGDAHIEQYAITATDRGLDDFDNTALGPTAVDLVRFIASIELIAELRGWQPSSDQIIERFFEGYRSALEDPEIVAAVPALVERLRAAQHVDVAAFIERSENLMMPLEGYTLDDIEAGLELVREMLGENDPKLNAEYMRIKSIGELHIGVGSALTPKLLMRLEGPTPDDLDDVILEAKQMEDISGVSCLTIPPGGEPLRVVYGATRVGRLDYEILAYVPWSELKADASGTNWFARSWHPSFVEVTIADLETPEELAELALDAGIQLGEGHVRGLDQQIDEQIRRAQLQVVDELGGDVRALARELLDAMMEAHAVYAVLATTDEIVP